MSRVEKAFCRSAPWRAFTRHLVLPWALQGTRLGGEVLEIGAGSGAMAEELLATTPAITMCVTDFDQAMVSTAVKNLAGFGTRITARQADATALPFGDASFDTVLSWIMLHHTVAWEKALTEAVRVLRPGGLLLGYDLVAAGAMRWLHRAEDADHRMVGIDELRAELERLPVVDVSVRPGLGRVVMRFKARRAPTRSI
ncbi:MAG: class I SAM-dependent methyltransferase [Actinomycetota bacterium]|nr:class I SAM-dependent methyltransferase [Actinomycetota bacterium]